MVGAIAGDFEVPRSRPTSAHRTTTFAEPSLLCALPARSLAYT